MSAGTSERYARALARLSGLARFGVRLGLDEIAAVLRALGDPQRRFPSLHIAGTNGKGSTAAFAESMLRAAGLRTGLYTSPHLVRFTERVQIAGQEIEPDAIAGCVERVLAAPGGDALTFFEVVTAAAFLAFTEARIEVAVVECGLGGRLDATSTCAPFATVITRVALDHAEVLGDTTEKIAAEKAGIARPGVPLLVGPLEPGPRAVIDAIAQKAGAPVLAFGRDFDARASMTSGDAGLVIDYDGPGGPLRGARLGLPGDFQIGNAALAIAAASFAPRGLHPDDEARRAGLAAARWPARIERLAPDLRIDGAHNPDAAEALATQLAREPKVTLLLGMLADKDVDGVLAALVPHAARVVCTRPASTRALPAEALAEHVRRLSPAVPVEAVGDPAAALALARDGAQVVVCGSLYLAGAVRAIVTGEPRDPLPVADPPAIRRA